MGINGIARLTAITQYDCGTYIAPHAVSFKADVSAKTLTVKGKTYDIVDTIDYTSINKGEGHEVWIFHLSQKTGTGDGIITYYDMDGIRAVFEAAGDLNIN